MFTAAQLTAAADTLDLDAIIRTRLYCRQAPDYRSSPRRYADLDTKLLDASTDADLARPINALLGILDAIEAQGPEKTVGIRGGQKALNYDRARDRGLLQDYLLHVLYDIPGEFPTNFIQKFNQIAADINNPTI